MPTPYTSTFTVEALNVKTALFFLAFLPQFVDPGAALAPNWCCWAASALRSIRSSMSRRSSPPIGCSDQGQPARPAHAFMTRMSGTTMMGLGVFLALARRET